MQSSALLQELIKCSESLGTKRDTPTAEGLLVSLIDKIQSESDGSEEFLAAKELVTAAVPDLSYARAVLMEHIHVKSESDDRDIGIDVVYLSLRMEAAKQNCAELKLASVSTVELLKCIFADPSETIKKVLKAETKTEIQETAGWGALNSALANLAETMGKSKEGAKDTRKKEKKVEKQPDPPKDADAVKKELATLIEEVKSIRGQLKSKVFGQDNAINVFVTGYFRARMLSMTDQTRRRPKATFLFAGPPGVGKTFLAESVAEALHMKDKFKVFDMSEYCDKEAATEFCGSDAVYKNSKGGNLTTYVSQNPECVLLFDEIEKAHMSIIHLFLQILDAGRIRDSQTDQEISLKDAILIFTTNAGKGLYEDYEDGDLSALSRKVILNALRKDINPQTGEPFFPGAICSRFASGNVVMFNHIKAHDLLQIARSEILRHSKNIKAQSGIDIQIQEEVYSALLFSEGGNVDARTIRARAETFVNDELYELLRLVATEKVKTTIEDLEKIQIEIDLNGAQPEIKALFAKETSQRILVLASEERVARIKEKLGEFDVIGVQSKAEAIEAMKNAQVDIAMLDMRYGTAHDESDALNIEDIESPAREFHKFLQEQRSSVPVFLLEDQASPFTEEEKDSFLKQGIRGVLSVANEEDDLAEQVGKIADSLHQQACLTKLAGENKLVSFETIQTVSDDGKTATIRLFDFELAVVVDSEDAKDVLSSVSRPNVKFADVIGANDAKSELAYFVNYLQNPRKYTGTGVKAPRGVLLYGPPGTGKTMLAKAMACESGVTFIAAEGNQFLKRFVGQGPEKVHELFRTARKYAPSILFVDEIDAIAKERRGEDNTGIEETLTAFLAEMDGFSTNPAKPVFVLAATNFDVEPGRSKSLDPALMRRFDRKVYIELPDKDGRIQFMKMKLNKNPALQISEQQIKSIAIRSTGMSLAELDSAMELALRSAIRKGSTTVTDSILEEAFETYNGGEAKKWDESQLERIARHEAGHAFLCWQGGETPSYLTIVARGDHGGYMQHGDQEGKAIYTKEELLARIRTSLGGRASEIVYYGEKDGISTGASGDLRNASDMAQRLICSYGMDDDFGLAVIGNAVAANGTMSIEVRAAVNRILKEQMAAAISLIRENQESVDALVEALLEKNYMNEAEIRAVLSKKGS